MTDSASPSMTYLAHSANDAGRTEPVEEHLSAVADTASRFAHEFGAEAEARTAGLLHDLGKFGTRFQDRLADPAHVKGVDHWSFGAEFASLHYAANNALLPVALECVIRGHHVGLAQATADLRSRRAEAAKRLEEWAVHLGEADPHPILSRFRETGLLLPSLQESIYQAATPTAVAGMLDVRMLFSALVDADFLETEAHFNGTAEAPRVYRAPAPSLHAEQALAAVSREIEQARGRSDAAADMLEIREALLNDCLAAAQGPRGLYTLSAPTGAGKTLAMLAFALKHAAVQSCGAPPLRRVVTTIPFLTIIEQTAGIYRRIFDPVFGGEYVIEDHSQAERDLRMADCDPAHASSSDDRRARERRRLLAQNWDAPMIVTTSVQMLESLFANRPRACRKLHRLANSVLLFDEVQTLPPRLAVATLAAVSRLVERYGCTAVFATATQPAFEHLGQEVQKQCAAGWKPTEIVREPNRMFAASAQRTRVDWRLDMPMSWDAVADELAAERQVLCVVNLKRHAKQLVEQLQDRDQTDGLLHLSTNLCPVHREVVLTEVREKLRRDQPCRLVATQCIEAGVDVDFPLAYRALGPLEAVAQVAGRCNRGGKSKKPKRVVVFIPEQGEKEKALYPPGYGEAALHAQDFVCQWEGEHGDASTLIHNPDALAACFRQFYDLSGKTRLPPVLAEALQARDFENVAAEYRLIDSDTVRVLVPYDIELYRELRRQADPFLPFDQAREWFARAAPLAVNIYRPARDADTSALIAVQVGSREQSQDEADWFILADETLYDSDRMGLLGLGGMWIV